MSITRNEDVYYYTQIFCGGCGHFVTDMGGFVSPAFAAAMTRGESQTPGVDLLSRHPEYFSEHAREDVVHESGPCGLSGARLLMEALTQPDPTFPRLYLQPWLCFHSHEAEAKSGTPSTGPMPKVKRS
ncbi:hypothetical protein F5X99DRAFT_410902 [Biscogniauxia marginata]|nr:hypothetical protein F5X99DRAFT_410902 [Biscogniauxia marginata]